MTLPDSRGWLKELRNDEPMTVAGPTADHFAELRVQKDT